MSLYAREEVGGSVDMGLFYNLYGQALFFKDFS